jgi:hypothetical protein
VQARWLFVPLSLEASLVDFRDSYCYRGFFCLLSDP